MKKLIISAALVLLSITALADIVSRQQAAEYAELRFGTTPTFVWDGTSSSSETPSFYVFNNPRGGWVIISADDAAEPLIGYSDRGTFTVEGMPVNMKNWLAGRSTEISYIRKAGFKQSADQKKRWDTFAYRTKGSTGVELKTAEWDQNSPYNALCKFEGSYSYVGCVATAMAIVLHYHQWPEHGTGTIGSYTTRTKKYSVPASDINGHYYYWSSMPTTTAGMNSAPEAIRNNVCQLMYDCATMVEMDFTPDGSGAYSSDVAPALVEHMGYDECAEFLDRSKYQDNDWLMMLKEEFDNNRPVLYSGYGNSGGHEFVADGYDANMNIHFNWGWSSSHNGYFNINNLNPSYSFNEGHDMVIHLTPKGGTPIEVKSNMSLYGKGAAGSLQIATGQAVKGQNFSLKAFSILNAGSAKYTGTVQAVILDKDGNIKEAIGDTIKIEDLGSFYYCTLTENYPCKFTSDIKYGDVITLVYSDKDTWKTIGIYDTSGKGELKKEVPVCKYAFIRPPKDPKVGDTFCFELIPSTRVISSTKFSYDGLETKQGAFVVLTEGPHIVEAEVTYSDGKTETLRRCFTAAAQP